VVSKIAHQKYLFTLSRPLCEIEKNEEDEGLMRNLLLIGVAVAVVGCGNSHPNVRKNSSVSTVTFPVAFGNYSRVYNTTYHIVNRYSVVRKASYKQGVIEAELSQDTSLFEKTRRTILARLFDTGDYWDVEVRVLIEVETSDVETLGEFQPRYKWQVVSYDQFLETRLNKEIKAALTGGAWESKAPLKYKGVASLSAPKGVRFGPIKASPKKALQAEKSDAPSKKTADERRDGMLNKALKKAKKRLEQEDAPHSSRNISHERSHKGLNVLELERLGVHYLQTAKIKSAQNSFRSALFKDPSSASASALLTLTHFILGQYKQGAKVLTKNMKHSGAWDKAKIDLRSFYKDASKFQQQTNQIKSHINKNPRDIDARLVLGWVSFFTQDYKSAEQILSFVSLAQPQNKVARSYLHKAKIQGALSSGNLREF
jgi:tetratricopeptide (TPR) repeat protein